MNPEIALQAALFIVAIAVGVPVAIIALRVIAGAAEAILGSAFIAVVIFIGVLIMVVSNGNFFAS